MNVQKELTDFERGMKYNEAMMYEFILKYPNDKELGRNIRNLVTRLAKNNPYKKLLSEIADEVEKQK